MSEWILEVYDDAQRTIPIWADAIKGVLANQKQSLDKAIEYRTFFTTHFDWQTAARLFLERIDQLKNGSQ